MIAPIRGPAQRTRIAHCPGVCGSAARGATTVSIFAALGMAVEFVVEELLEACYASWLH